MAKSGIEMNGGSEIRIEKNTCYGNSKGGIILGSVSVSATPKTRRQFWLKILRSLRESI